MPLVLAWYTCSNNNTTTHGHPDRAGRRLLERVPFLGLPTCLALNKLIILFSNSRYSFLARGLRVGSRRTRRRDEEHAIGPASSLALCGIPTTAAVDLWLRICIFALYMSRGGAGRKAPGVVLWTIACPPFLFLFTYLLCSELGRLATTTPPRPRPSYAVAPSYLFFI